MPEISRSMSGQSGRAEFAIFELLVRMGSSGYGHVCWPEK